LRVDCVVVIAIGDIVVGTVFVTFVVIVEFTTVTLAGDVTDLAVGSGTLDTKAITGFRKNFGTSNVLQSSLLRQLTV
jgi:hypothetical protein